MLILPLGEYPGNNVWLIELNWDVPWNGTESNLFDDVYEGQVIGENISGFKANKER